MAQMKPDVMDKIDSDKVVDSYADMLGVDPDLIVGDDQVALIRQDRAKVQQQQAQQRKSRRARHREDSQPGEDRQREQRADRCHQPIQWLHRPGGRLGVRMTVALSSSVQSWRRMIRSMCAMK
jgi:hypothetical protein